MPKTPATPSGFRAPTPHSRLRQAAIALAATATVAVLAGACSSHEPDAASNAGTASSGTTSGGGGRVSPGSTASPAGNAHGGNVGSFTAEFAKCMRDHGVPNFPDPNGQAGQLGPNSGIDPASAPFQAAINGPCKSLAPGAWLSSDSGPDSMPGGGE
jgi:hypothetical protein